MRPGRHDFRRLPSSSSRHPVIKLTPELRAKVDEAGLIARFVNGRRGFVGRTDFLQACRAVDAVQMGQVLLRDEYQLYEVFGLIPFFKVKPITSAIADGCVLIEKEKPLMGIPDSGGDLLSGT